MAWCDRRTANAWLAGATMAPSVCEVCMKGTIYIDKSLSVFYTLSSILDIGMEDKMALLDTEDFLSQTGKAMVGVARLLLHYSKGEKLPRMVDIAHKLKSGNGTIQEAFNHLTKLGA